MLLGLSFSETRGIIRLQRVLVLSGHLASACYRDEAPNNELLFQRSGSDLL